jgi:AcrR family transcriptional regulator
MSRWEPDALGRLEQAAFALYAERGFDQTTAAEIAKRAGLTERTFFRHYADKREVLFGGSSVLQDHLVQAVADEPDSAAPIDAISAALQSTGRIFDERRERSRQRQAVIAANPELQERELIKMSTIAAALTDALRRRGVHDTTASLAAEAGITVFRMAFERWLVDTGPPDLARHLRDSFAQLKAVTAEGTG